MRYIGITHRVKFDADGKPRPTMVAVRVPGKKKVAIIKLATETNELDWVRGKHPVGYRDVTEDEDLSQFLAHHVKWVKATAEQASVVPANLVRHEGETFFIATEVPAAYDGLSRGDIVGMVLGGSGDKLAFALSRVAGELGKDTQVLRIPSFFLNEERGDGNKDDDAQLLSILVEEKQERFYSAGERDRALIKVAENLSLRTDAMKSRIGCEQRLRQRLIGKVFCSEEGKYPEGELEDSFKALVANDAQLQVLVAEENTYKREIERSLESLSIYRLLFKSVEGCGPLIAARIIGAVKTILRFESAAKLKSYCGVAPRKKDADGELIAPNRQFPRRRHGQVSNWHPDVRQALYLLAEQFNRRPNSVWGQILRRYKAKFRSRISGGDDPIQVAAGLVPAFRMAEHLLRTEGDVSLHAFIPESGLKTEGERFAALDEALESYDEAVTLRAAHGVSPMPADTLKKLVLETSRTGDKKMKKIFSRGHIHKMAMWRTVTRFVEWLYQEWTALEEAQKKGVPYAVTPPSILEDLKVESPKEEAV